MIRVQHRDRTFFLLLYFFSSVFFLIYMLAQFIYLFIYFLAVWHMGLRSPTRDRTCTLCTGGSESHPVDDWESSLQSPTVTITTLST